jgi:predicted O-methyltransferase YrrM
MILRSQPESIRDAHNCQDGLYGRADSALTLPFSYITDRWRLGPLGRYVWFSRQVPGWTRGSEAIKLAEFSASLPKNAVVVEIGSFLGCSAILLAGGRKIRGSGEVHCVDPFDASGDAFSEPIYQTIRKDSKASLRQRFDENLARAGLSTWVRVHAMQAQEAVRYWVRPIDLLYLDGNQEYDVVVDTYSAWSRFLRPGGILAVHNSRPGYRRATHDGSSRLVEQQVRVPAYRDIQQVGSTTFATRAPHDSHDMATGLGRSLPLSR